MSRSVSISLGVAGIALGALGEIDISFSDEGLVFLSLVYCWTHFDAYRKSTG